MKLYPDAAPVKGRWVVIKCDSGPGRLNTTLLAYLRYHGFILYPGVPNTTAVMQETDQSYGLFQSAVRTNLQLIIDERIAADKPKSLLPWIVGLVVFGGEDPETGLIVGSAFQRGFSTSRTSRHGKKLEQSHSAGGASQARRSVAQSVMALTISRHWCTCSSSTTQLPAMR